MDATLPQQERCQRQITASTSLRGRTDLRSYAASVAAAEAHAALLGPRACDIGMNAASLWRCVPEAVWDCRIGGYQVLKKWLSYRDASITGHPLTPDQVQHFQHSARRIAAILLLAPELDASHQACTEAHAILAPP